MDKISHKDQIDSASEKLAEFFFNLFRKHPELIDKIMDLIQLQESQEISSMQNRK